MKEAVKNPLTSAYEVGRSLNEMKAMPLSVEWWRNAESQFKVRDWHDYPSVEWSLGILYF